MTPAMRWVLACLLVPWAPPAAAQPTDPIYLQASAARQAGKPAAAIKLLEPWLAAHPDDVDARVQLGYSLVALGRYDEAEREFRKVLAQAPDYRDASDGLALIDQRRVTPSTKRGFLLVEGAIAKIDNSSQDWTEAGVALNAPLGTRDTIDLGAIWYRRFGTENTSLSGLWTHRSGDDLWLRLGAIATPQAVFRPRAGVNAGTDYQLSGGRSPTILSLDARWEDFPVQQVWTIAPGATQYLADGRFSLTAKGTGVIAEGDRLRVGALVRADYLPGNRSRAFIGAAAGPDTELGVVTNTKSLFAGGELPLSGPVSLTGSIAREWRSGPGDRTEFRLGVKVGL